MYEQKDGVSICSLRKSIRPRIPRNYLRLHAITLDFRTAAKLLNSERGRETEVQIGRKKKNEDSFP